MIAADTNLLIRLLVEDDKKQLAAAKRVFGKAEIEAVLLLNTVLLETACVLQTVYAATRNDVAKGLTAVMALPGVVLETPAATRAVEWYRTGMDFGDALHLAGAEGRCSALLTFDTGFVRRAKGKTACTVAAPA